jgi:thiamine pyrophosphate-dependent acetolactate synthase large subunit-like protein
LAASAGDKVSELIQNACRQPRPAARGVPGAIPNPDALAELAVKMQRAKNLALVVGSSIDRDGAFDLVVQLAERSGTTV